MLDFLQNWSVDRRYSYSHTKMTSFDDIKWFNREAPSRLKTVYLYSKGYFWKKLSRFLSTWPYVSGDAFVKLADLSIVNFEDLRNCNESTVEKSRVIFVKGDLFPKFALQFQSVLNSKQKVITGNSDMDFDEIPLPLRSLEFSWFVQNSSILGDSRVTTIPIGIENISYGNYGRPRHLKVCKEFSAERVLFGPMGDTHNQRRMHLSSALNAQNIFFIPPNRLNHRRYVELSSNFKYVFCVRGNGMDTHRFWESLYRGQTPIVLESEWSRSLCELNLPFIAIKDIDALQQLAPNLEWHKSDFDPRDIDALWMPYWSERILPPEK